MVIGFSQQRRCYKCCAEFTTVESAWDTKVLSNGVNYVVPSIFSFTRGRDERQGIWVQSRLQNVSKYKPIASCVHHDLAVGVHSMLE